MEHPVSIKERQNTSNDTSQHQAELVNSVGTVFTFGQQPFHQPVSPSGVGMGGFGLFFLLVGHGCSGCVNTIEFVEASRRR